MDYLILSLLFIIAVLFYMLEVAFKSFSKISLAGFMEDSENEKIKGFDYVENHEVILHALRVFSFILQLALFIYAYILLAPVVRRLARLPPPHHPPVRATLDRRIKSVAGRHQIYTVRLAGAIALPAFKASGDITSLSQADGYIEIPADVEALDAGTAVDVHLF